MDKLANFMMILVLLITLWIVTWLPLTLGLADNCFRFEHGTSYQLTWYFKSICKH